MPGLPLTLTCADYARVMPLATGAIKPEGVALDLVLGRGGSWEMRAEMLRRALPRSGCARRRGVDAMVNLICTIVAR